MMTDKEKQAGLVDNNIARYQAAYEELDGKAEAAEKVGDVVTFQKLHIEALNARSELEYWTAYKVRNPILWQPDPELEQPGLPNITKRQIKLWLLQKGKNPKTYPAEQIAKIPDETLRVQVEIEWEDGDSYSRDRAFIQALIKVLDWSDEAVDSVWKEIAAVD